MASFTTRIKDEVTKIETEKCESLAEVCSYIYFNGNITNKNIIRVKSAGLVLAVIGALIVFIFG